MNFQKQYEKSNPNSTYNILKNRPSLSPKITTYQGPNKLYKNINNIAIQMTPNEPFTYNLTDIPNCLKVVEEDRKTIIIKMDKIGQYPLQYIIGHIPDSTLYIHVGRGEGTLVCEKDKAIGHRTLKTKLYLPPRPT